MIWLLVAGCARPATLTEVQDQIFTPSCGFSSCHGGNAGQLDLSPGNSFAQLVDVPVVGADRPTFPDVDVTGLVRVIPGDADNSYLVKKCAGPDGIKGAPMPDGSQGMAAEDLALMASWIDNGALDD